MDAMSNFCLAPAIFPFSIAFRHCSFIIVVMGDQAGNEM